MRTVAPHPQLAPLVRDVMVVEVSEETQRLRLPEPGLVLAVRYRGFASIGSGDDGARLPDVCLTGMAVRARLMRTSAHGAAILVRFRPGGAAHFFRQPLHELLGASLALSELAPSDVVDRLHDEVGDARDDEARARAVERFLFEQQRDRSDSIVSTAVECLGGVDSSGQVRELSERFGLSLDAFEKRFRRVVGCSPRQFASLSRLRRAIDSYRPGLALTRLALDAGYYDQSHFNREFRAVTGESPGRFFGLQRSGQAEHVSAPGPVRTTRVNRRGRGAL